MTMGGFVTPSDHCAMGNFLQCDPVNVPQRLSGFFPVVPVTANTSVHNPVAATSVRSNAVKSSRSWQMAIKDKKPLL